MGVGWIGEKYHGKVWRYVDLTKFLHILTSKTLFFPSIDMLKRTDPYEGEFGPATLRGWDVDFSSMSDEQVSQKANDARLSVDLASARKFLHMWPEILQQLSRSSNAFTAVSCWHCSPMESFGMWEVYLKGKPGVAIVTTAQKLENLAGTVQAPDVKIGRVAYEDLNEKQIEFSIYAPVFTKREYFAYEQELRISARVTPPPGIPPAFGGMSVPIDPNSLISEIWLPPFADEWQATAISETIKIFGLSIPIRTSQISEKPPLFFMTQNGIASASPKNAAEQIAKEEQRRIIRSSFMYSGATRFARTPRRQGITIKELVREALATDGVTLSEGDINAVTVFDMADGALLQLSSVVPESLAHIGFYTADQNAFPEPAPAPKVAAEYFRLTEEMYRSMRGRQ